MEIEYKPEQQAGFVISDDGASAQSAHGLFSPWTTQVSEVKYSFGITSGYAKGWPAWGTEGGASPMSNRASLVDLLNDQEAERKRISRELHDGIGQLLTNINLRVQHCLIRTKGCEDLSTIRESLESLESVSGLVAEAMGEVRNICSALRPAILDDLGLLEALSWQCRQCREAVSGLGTEVDFSLRETEIPEEYKTAIYRICQEALNNAAKYAEATRIGLRIARRERSILLAITDNGRGVDMDRPRQPQRDGFLCRNGLRNMRERAELLGGEFRLESMPGQGTRIEIHLPLPA